MANKSGSLDYWRKFFRSTNSDIFEVIESALTVAASDYSKEFLVRRDKLAAKLFSCRWSHGCSCDHIEVKLPEREEEANGIARAAEKESRVNGSCNERRDETNQMERCSSYNDVEALTEAIEEKKQIVGEVLRIKEVLGNMEDESESVLFESLRRLQLMDLSMDIFKATEIGIAVNTLRKHKSKRIRHLVRTLIVGWKVLVDEYVSANPAAAIADCTPDSVNPSVVEEDGLPSPPLDEGAFLATTITTIKLSEFFDGMDEDGNLHSSDEFENRENGRKSVPENLNPLRKQLPQRQTNVPNDTGIVRKQEGSNGQTKPQALTPTNQCKPSGTQSGQMRPPKISSERQAIGNADIKFQQQDPTGVQNKPPTRVHDKPKNPEDAAVKVKLEISKRKLNEGYEQAANAKKQRTIQVMELNELPKQGLNHRQGLKHNKQTQFSSILEAINGRDPDIELQVLQLRSSF